MSFEFSKFNVVDFNRMTYTDHLIAIVECGKDSPHFNAHLEKVLNWGLTNNIINSVADTMYDYYGASALGVVYKNLSKENIVAELQLKVYECLSTSFSLDKFYSNQEIIERGSKNIKLYYTYWLKLYLKKSYCEFMLEEAKTFYPALTRTYLTKYVRMRKDSGYSIDLNNSDAEIAEILGCNATSIAITNLRQAFAEYDEYCSLKEKASDYAQPEEQISIDEMRSSVEAAMASLSEDDRKIIIGIYINGETVRSYAQKTGISKSKIQKQKQYAIEKLRAAVM